MRCILIFLLLFSGNSFAQWKDYKLTSKGDTINRIDQKDQKQWEWILRYETVRGEPGYEEEGIFKDNKKEGEWRLFTLTGDLVGIENYRWGFKDGICRYFNKHGELMIEQSWRAFNPDKEYDTVLVENVDQLNNYENVVVKNEGAAVKHGAWKYYNTETGAIVRTETYILGKLHGDSSANSAANADPSKKKAVAKPKEVMDFEKKNSGKKKVKYKDGTTGGF